MMTKVTTHMEEIKVNTMTKTAMAMVLADTMTKVAKVMGTSRISATIYLTNMETEIMVMVSNVVMVKTIQDLTDLGINSSVNNSIKKILFFFVIQNESISEDID